MNLIDLFRRNVRIVCDNGLVVEGFVHCYTSAEDNEPDPESISIGNYELFESDIESATILD